MKRLILTIAILVVAQVSFLQAQCMYVESILVDACEGPCPGSSIPEGENEMVLLKVGPNPLTIAYGVTGAAAVLTPTWPNNSFKGWQAPGPLTNPLVASLNSTIVKCGYLLEPTGGVLPASSQVLIITSTNMCTSCNSFANLTDTLYVLFQVAGNTAGHFANNNNSAAVTTVPTGSVSPRTLTMAYSGTPSCTESVTYDRSLLVDTLGLYGGGSCKNNGATVQFDVLGNATYVNNGCQAPYIPIQVSATAPATVCVNASATLDAVVSGPAVTYTWSTSGNGAISTPTGTLSGTGSTTLSPSYTPTATESGTITFTLTAQGKCSLDVSTATTSIDVIALPTPTVTSSGNTICNGSSLVLSVNGQSGSTYSWNPGAGTGTSFTVSPSSQTVYTATATNACASIDATFTVDVNALPTVSATSASVCPGFTATISASGASTYTWNTGAVNGSLSDAPASTTVYTVTGTDGNGCENTATGTIFIFNSPTVTVNSPVICAGATVALEVTGATTYTWSTTESGDSISVSPGSSASYTVTGTDLNGCTDTDVSSVTVNQLPNVIVNSVTICPGSTATLTANGASTYTWSTTANGNSISVTPASNASYTVTGTDANGCINFDVASVAIVNSLTVTAAPASALVCSGTPTNLTANGAASYTWSPAGSLSSATGATVTATPTTNTTYTVIGSSGTCADTNVVTVNVNNLPNVTVNSATICTGDPAALSANGANSYSWSPAGGLSSTTGNSVTATPAISASYTVTGTDANNCVNTAVANVVVNSLPSVTVNSPAICAGSTATLTASGAFTFTWSTSQNGSSISVSPSGNASYTVSGTDANACVGSSVASVTVNALPNISSTNATVCSGTTATLTANGGTMYTWSTAQTGSAISVAPLINASYTVVGTDNNGCSNFSIASVTVEPLPVISVNSPSVCAGSAATLTATGAASYVWSNAQTGSSITVNPSGTATYSVVGTGLNGCTGISTATVTVSQPPVIAVNSPTACANSTTTLTANGASTYTWSTLQAGASINVPGTTASYTVIGQDALGCLDTAVASVTQINAPTPQTVAGNSVICNGQSGILSVTSGPYTYSWAGPGGNLGTTSSISVNQAGVYTLTTTNSCGSISSQFTVTVSSPQASFSANTYSGTSPLGVVFTNASTGTIVSNYWNFSNGDTSYQQNPGTTYAMGGVYTVTLTVVDQYGCIDTAMHIITVTDTLIPIIIPNIFSPNGDNVNEVFMIHGGNVSDFNCKIYDRWGVLMYEFNDIHGSWDGRNISSGHPVSDGTYYYLISYRSSKGQFEKKPGFLQLVR